MAAATAVRLTAHGASMMHQRRVLLQWVEDTLRDPMILRPDAKDGTLKLAFRKIPEAGERWLRVVYRLEGNTHIIVTAFFDRDQEKRK